MTEPAARVVPVIQTGPPTGDDAGNTHSTSERAAWYAALAVIAFATVLRIIVGARLP